MINIRSSFGLLFGKFINLLPICLFLLLVTQAKAQATVGTVELSPSQSYAIVDTSAATYTVTVNKSGDGPMSAALSFNGLSNVNATFSPDTLVFGETDASLTSTLTVLPTTGSSAGTFDISVTATDESSGSASGYAQILVKEPTTLVVKTKAGPKGANLNLVAQLFSGANGVFGKTVYFAVDGVPVGSDVTSLAGWAGVPYTVPATFDTGSVHTITAVYANNDDPVYATSGGSASLTVWKADTTMVTTAVAGPSGGKVRLEAFLYADGVGVGLKTVRFKVNGAIVGDAQTGNLTAPGRAALWYDIPAGRSIGDTMTVTATFNGDADYWSSNNPATLTISKIDTVVQVRAVTGTSGLPATFAAMLRSGSGTLASYTPLSGKLLQFEVDGQVIGNATTRADGWAVLNTPVPNGFALNSTHLVTVSFADASDPAYGMSGNTNTMTISKAVVRVIALNVSGTPGAKVMLQGNLQVDVNNRVVGRTLHFAINGVEVGTGVTNSNGYAGCWYTVPAGAPVGTNSLTVTFTDEDPVYVTPASGSATLGIQ